MVHGRDATHRRRSPVHKGFRLSEIPKNIIYSNTIICYTKFKKKYPKTANALETARHALTIAKGVASVINVEFKHIDTAGTTVNPTATGVVLPMNSCAEGTASYRETDYQ